MQTTYKDETHYPFGRATDLHGVRFTPAGTQLMYVDNPEYVSDGFTKYHYSATLPLKTRFDVEYYMHVSNGSGASGRAGLALKNTGSSTATVYIMGNAIASAPNSTEPGEKCAGVIATAFNAPTVTYQIGAGKTVFVDKNGTDTIFTHTTDKNTLCYGRYILNSQNSGVEVRVFTGNTQTTAASVFSSPLSEGNNTETFCGLVAQNERRLTLPATAGYGFLIGVWAHNGAHNQNDNEYVGYTPKKSGTVCSVLGGNYGVIYNLTFTQAAGKKLKLILPKTSNNGCLAMSVNNAKWQKTKTLKSGDITSGDCITCSLGSGSTANVRVVIPGGNNGNIRIEPYV